MSKYKVGDYLLDCIGSKPCWQVVEVRDFEYILRSVDGLNSIRHFNIDLVERFIKYSCPEEIYHSPLYRAMREMENDD